jgi:hypothetical protein
MPTITEAFDSQSPLKGPLDQGLETISGSQEITFTQYVQLILPLDGYVYWVRSDLVSQLAVCGCYKFSGVPADGTQPYGPFVKVRGSLHYGSRVEQREDETINTVDFAAEEPIQELNAVGPCVMYIGDFEGRRFAFNKRGSFYRQADVYHYSGEALYPALASQLVDTLEGFDTSNVVVSNSLPIWLTLNQFMPMYPSFLVKENLEPPYASIHIPAESTRALAARPAWDNTGSHSQLVQERVKITLYGLRNFSALDFQDSLDTDLFGVMNMPVMQDEKRTQSELKIIAQKKVFELEINYYQRRVRDIARQLITKCLPNVIIGEL